MTTVLFDFDGVIADTEREYDVFWGKVGAKYRLGEDFPARIKGMTMQSIFQKYFFDTSEKERKEIEETCAAYEQHMDFREVAGAVRFLQVLKEKGIRMGLVTSSPEMKMEIALKKMNLESVFDSIVTAERVTRGKPDPMGYLTAASDLGAAAETCVVFEDSFSGIQAGVSAGMKVIGLSTTRTPEELRDKVYVVIPDFTNIDKVLSYILK